MLSYMETCLIGIRGIVTDAGTGAPLNATITVAGRNHEIYTDPDVGDYHRMLLPGTYSLTFTAAGYDPITVNNVVVTSGAATRLDVAMGEGPPVTQDVNVDVIGADTITLAGTDPNGDPIDFIITSLPTHGDLSDPNAGNILAVPYTLASGGNQVDYQVDAGYTGPDSFQFKATDGLAPPTGGESNTSTVYVTVLSPPPAITTTTLPDGTYNMAYGPVQLQASDGQSPLTWSLVTDVAYVETDLGSSQFTNSGVGQGWSGDDSFWTYSPPFAFPFYGNDYTSIRIWSNGFIDFGSFSGSSYQNSTTSLINNRMIAPLWDDLRTDQAGNDIYIDESVPGQVTIRFEAVTGGDMEDVEAVGTIRDATAVFHYQKGRWGTGGKALFNMDPQDALVRLEGQYEAVDGID